MLAFFLLRFSASKNQLHRIVLLGLLNVVQVFSQGINKMLDFISCSIQQSVFSFQLTMLNCFCHILVILPMIKNICFLWVLAELVHILMLIIGKVFPSSFGFFFLWCYTQTLFQAVLNIRDLKHLLLFGKGEADWKYTVCPWQLKIASPKHNNNKFSKCEKDVLIQEIKSLSEYLIRPSGMLVTLILYYVDLCCIVSHCVALLRHIGLSCIALNWLARSALMFWSWLSNANND